jgi:hypothetical protein
MCSLLNYCSRNSTDSLLLIHNHTYPYFNILRINCSTQAIYSTFFCCPTWELNESSPLQVDHSSQGLSGSAIPMQLHSIPNLLAKMALTTFSFCEGFTWASIEGLKRIKPLDFSLSIG